MTPYYNKPSQEGLYQHFKALHDSADVPILIYNIPGRSAIDMSVETMASLAKLPRMVGVKDATGDLSRVPKQRMACGKEFIQLSGEDATALGFNAHGRHGMHQRDGERGPRTLRQDAGSHPGRRLTRRRSRSPTGSCRFTFPIFLEPGLAGAKYGLSLLGRCSEEVRLPIVTPSDPTRNAIREAMDAAGILQ